jgi:16S rRNA (guanine527-N7)-methyltransferase
VPAPLVTSRALAPLPALLSLAHPLLAENGFCLLPKSRAAEAEITQAERTWSMRLERLASLTDPNGMILKISELHPIG